MYIQYFTIMNERLKQFLTMEGISPARFAEVVGINRSGISHLLAGRNKPSFEFIQKLLTSYPTLNPEWLILGKGKPYKDGRIVENPAPEIPQTVQVPLEEPVLFEENSEPELFIDLEEDSQPLENQKKFPDIEYDREKSAVKIARITVFYSDGTFEDR